MNLYDRILVTGGRGMLAHAFQRLLAARGVGETFVARDQCDIANPIDVALTFERVRPTLVINCAA